MRRLVLALVIAFFALPAPPAAATTYWVRPVPGPVARPFDPPLSRYGPGHLGVDFRAAPGTPVRAVGPGTVVFAGLVAGTRHVVVRHANGWRTSYSFLASVRVHRDEQVHGDEVVGTTGGRGDNHDGVVLHLGLRIGDRYVDPMQLFGEAEVDLPAVVHLAPVAAAGPAPPSSAQERAGLGQGLPPDDYPLVGP